MFLEFVSKALDNVHQSAMPGIVSMLFKSWEVSSNTLHVAEGTEAVSTSHSASMSN